MSGTRLTSRCETGQTNLGSRRGIRMRIKFRPGAIAATATGGPAVAGLGYFQQNTITDGGGGRYNASVSGCTG